MSEKLELKEEIEIKEAECCIHCKNRDFIKNSYYGVNCNIHKKSVQITDVCIKFDRKE